MHVFRKLLIFLLPALLNLPLVYAQEKDSLNSLSLDEAVKRALAYNLDLESAKLKLSIQKRNNDWAIRKLYPTISTGASYMVVNDTRPQTTLVAVTSQPPVQAIYETPDAHNIMLKFSAQFDLSWNTILAIQQTAIDYEASRINYGQSRNALVRDVKKLYYQLLVMQETVRVTQNQLNGAQQRFQDAQTNFDAGHASELTLVQAKVAWKNHQPQLENIKLNYLQLLLDFEELLNLEPNGQLTLSGSLDQNLPLIAVPYSNDDWSQRTNLLLAENNLRSAEKSQQMITSQAFPTFTLAYTADPFLNNPWNSETQWLKTSNWYQSTGAFSIGLSWKMDSFIPGSNFFVNRADQTTMVESARISLAKENLKAKKEILDLKSRIEKSQKTLITLEENQGSSQRAYELTLAAYKSGSRSLLEVQDSELEYESAQLALINEKLELHCNFLDLNNALGKNEEEINE